MKGVITYRMILYIYRVNQEMPEEYVREMLECERIWDITPGIYKKIDTLEVNYTKVSEIEEAIENDEIKLEKSDIVEMLPDEYMLNNHVKSDLEMEEQCNFLILTGLGVERIAIDKELVFKEMSFEAIREMMII